MERDIDTSCYLGGLPFGDEMKTILFILLISANANADYYHNYKIPDVSVEGNGTALSIAAAQHSFYWGTDRWQASLGMGTYNNDGAVSFGMGKMYDGILINFSIGGTESGKYGGGVGFTWIP